MQKLATFAMTVTMLSLSPSAAPAADAQLGLEGYCPVCIVDGGKWVAGKSDFSAQFDGRTYLFPDAGARDKFVASPEKYAPALNGDCIVCYQMHGARPGGSVKHAAAYQGRVYLFPGAGEKQTFLKDPAKYANADLGLDGNCVVCKVKAGKDVPGKPEFTAITNGIRYLFPSDAERKEFLANTSAYVGSDGQIKGAKTTTVSKPATPSNGTEMVSVEGRSACAFCEFKVHPINDPDQLGLAIKTDDGSIYVVEGAHKNYEKIYNDRFDLIRLNVKGKPIKKDGNVTWVEPQSVSRVN